MLFYSGLLFLVIAVSMDGFGVGVTYGIRKVRVPFLALFIIMLCSGVIVLFSMVIGNLLSSFISSQQAKVLGGFILISLGIFSLVNVFRTKLDFGELDRITKRDNTRLSTITVLATPTTADLDNSGTISANEALLLGTALALDAFGAGIGASMIGYSPLLTALLVFSMSGLFLHCGIKMGFILSKSKKLQRLTYLPPVLLITLGIINML